MKIVQALDYLILFYYFCLLKQITMAFPIASIPELTGEVAHRFETEAHANY